MTVQLRNENLDDAVRVPRVTNQFDQKVFDDDTMMIYPNVPTEQIESRRMAPPMHTGSLSLRRIVRWPRDACVPRNTRSSGQARVQLRAGCHGFTYIGLLAAIVIMGIGLAAVGPVSSTLQFREKERELLFVGDQFRRAIASYYEKTPGGLKQYPKKLEELLRDNRYPNVQRHLRKIYIDPLTGKAQWGLVELPGIGITGVYSLSDLPPIKTANFPERYKAFQSAKKYSDWKFVYVAGQVASPPGVPPTSPQIPTAPAK